MPFLSLITFQGLSSVDSALSVRCGVTWAKVISHVRLSRTVEAAVVQWRALVG